MASNQFFNTQLKHPDDLKRFKSNSSEKTEIDELKEKYKVYFYLRNSTSNTFELIQKKPNKTQDDENIIQRTLAQLLNLEADLTDIWNKMEEINKKQSFEDDENITIPEFGKNSNIDFYGVQGLLTFDPTQSTPTLFQAWESISQFVTNCNLTEKAMKTILSQKLKNEAFDIYMLYKEQPIHKIIYLLKDRFGSFPTIYDFETQYENFKRKPGETITTSMARYEMILKNLHRRQPPEEIRQIIERDCKSMVKRIALPEAKAQLDRDEQKAKINGRIFSYKDRLNKVLLEEQLYHRQKTGNIPSINTAQIQPDIPGYTKNSDIEKIVMGLNTIAIEQQEYQSYSPLHENTQDPDQYTPDFTPDYDQEYPDLHTY